MPEWNLIPPYDLALSRNPQVLQTLLNQILLPHLQMYTFAQWRRCPLTNQQPVNSQHTCWISRKVEFEHFFRYQLPTFVLSFGSSWRLQTFSRSLCNRFVSQQLNSSLSHRLQWNASMIWHLSGMSQSHFNELFWRSSTSLKNILLDFPCLN
jgi:hypothetical protein